MNVSQAPITNDMPEDAPSQDLIERLKMGDDKAWEELFQRHSYQIRHIFRTKLSVYHITNGSAKAIIDDAEQATWKAVHRSIHTFTPQTEGKFDNWVLTIAVRSLINILRKEPSNQLSWEGIDDSDNEGGTNVLTENSIYKNGLYTESIETEVLRNEIRAEFMPVFEKALRELSARDREIVVSHWLLGEKPKALATRYSMKVTNVHQVIYRAKNTIRAYLLAQGFFANSGNKRNE